MSRLYKFVLLLAFLSVFVSAQSCSAEKPNTTKITEISQEMDTLFGKDKTLSPLTLKFTPYAKLINTVVGYMRTKNTKNSEQLYKLFYEPDFNTWSALYKDVTGKQCSTVELVTFLDQTKTKIFQAYAALQKKPQPDARSAFLSVPVLLDIAMQKIFEGCWGISDEPQKPGVIDALKGVYGRVVSGLVTSLDTDEKLGDFVQSLDKKQPELIIPLDREKKSKDYTDLSKIKQTKQIKPKWQAHLAALQKIMGSVIYSFRVEKTIELLCNNTQHALYTRTFFKKVFPQIENMLDAYKNPLEKIRYDEKAFKEVAYKLMELFPNDGLVTHLNIDSKKFELETIYIEYDTAEKGDDTTIDPEEYTDKLSEKDIEVESPKQPSSSPLKSALKQSPPPKKGT